MIVDVGTLPKGFLRNSRSIVVSALPGFGFFFLKRSLASQKVGSMIGDRGSSPSTVFIVLPSGSISKLAAFLCSPPKSDTVSRGDASDVGFPRASEAYRRHGGCAETRNVVPKRALLFGSATHRLITALDYSRTAVLE